MPTKVISSLRRQGLSWGGSMQWGVTLIVLGVLSVALVLAGVAVNLAIAWLIVLAGLAQLVVAHHTRRVYSSKLETHRRVRICSLWCVPDRLSRAGVGFTHFGAVTAVSVRGHLRHLGVFPVAHNRRLKVGSPQRDSYPNSGTNVLPAVGTQLPSGW